MADNDPTQNPEPGDPDVDFEPESDEPDIEDEDEDEDEELDEGDVSRIREEADEAVKNAVEFADQSPEPSLETLYDELYVVGETMGWYAVDERSPEPHRGEYGEDAPDLAKELAESGADHIEPDEERSRPGVRN